MPGSKRKIDEDTWIVSQSKKFKQGILMSSVYETTLAHLRLGARQFFNSMLMRTEEGDSGLTENRNDLAALSLTSSTPPGPSASSSSTSPQRTTASPFNTPPGSPAVRDIISDNELQLQNAAAVPRPQVICQDCKLRTRNALGSEDSYGKCTYCEKLVCHLNPCRGCSSEFCKDCCIAKYDESAEAYECYGCLH